MKVKNLLLIAAAGFALVGFLSSRSASAQTVRQPASGVGTNVGLSFTDCFGNPSSYPCSSRPAVGGLTMIGIDEAPGAGVVRTPSTGSAELDDIFRRQRIEKCGREASSIWANPDGSIGFEC